MADYSITAVDRRVVYSGSAGTGPYAFTFPVLATTDIAVYKDATKLTEGSGSTQYTVALNASNGTGSVTLGAAATSDHTITITGARTIERTTDFVTAGDLLASSLNTELDSQTIFVQQASEDSARAIKAPVYDPTSIDMTLPAKADRLGKLLGFDSSTGNPEATTGRVNSVSVSTSTVGVGGSATGSATFTDSTGALALSLGIPTGATGATGSDGVFSAIASQAEAEGGSENTKGMTALRVKQAVDSYGLLASNNLSDVTASTARTNLGLAIGSDVQAHDADTLKADTADELTAGFSSAAEDAGTKSSGTFTPSPDGGNFQHFINGGAHTLGVPSKNCAMVLLMKNNSSAGTLTTSGYTKVDGDDLSTTNGDEFFLYVTRYNDGSTSFSALTVKALQ